MTISRLNDNRAYIHIASTTYSLLVHTSNGTRLVNLKSKVEMTRKTRRKWQQLIEAQQSTILTVQSFADGTL